jgi:hypothetical protein
MMDSAEIMARHAQRVAMQWSAHRATADEAMRGIFIDGRHALVNPALVAAFIASRGWVQDKGL